MISAGNFRRWIAIALLNVITTSAWADVSQVELELAARVLSFMEKPLTGNVRLGVVYVSGNRQSAASADAIVRLLGDGLKVGNLVLIPVRVNVDQALTAPVDAFFLPEGLGEQVKRISEATAKKKIPCITLDITQVQDGTCAIGVSVSPKVQIYVNRSAAADSDTTFASMFRMMITEF